MSKRAKEHKEFLHWMAETMIIIEPTEQTLPEFYVVITKKTILFTIFNNSFHFSIVLVSKRAKEHKVFLHWMAETMIIIEPTE